MTFKFKVISKRSVTVAQIQKKFAGLHEHTKTKLSAIDKLLSMAEKTLTAPKHLPTEELKQANGEFYLVRFMLNSLNKRTEQFDLAFFNLNARDSKDKLTFSRLNDIRLLHQYYLTAIGELTTQILAIVDEIKSAVYDMETSDFQYPSKFFSERFSDIQTLLKTAKEELIRFSDRVYNR